MAINKNKSDQKRCTRSQIYHKTIHTEHQNLREKPKQEKTVARKFTIIERLQGK